jgi:hypothetical protein
MNEELVSLEKKTIYHSQYFSFYYKRTVFNPFYCFNLLPRTSFLAPVCQ